MVIDDICGEKEIVNDIDMMVKWNDDDDDDDDNDNDRDHCYAST